MISGPCHHDIAHPQVAEDRQLTRSNPPVGGLGKVLITPHHKNLPCYKTFHNALDVYKTGEMNIRFWWGDLKGRDHLEHPGTDGIIILRCIFRKWDRGHEWN